MSQKLPVLNMRNSRTIQRTIESASAMHKIEQKALTKYFMGSCLLALSASTVLSLPIKAAVSITEVQTHTFPAVMTNKQTARLTVNQYGQLESIQGATVLGDYYNAGQYLLQSDSSNTITINITSLEDVPNVSLGSIQLLYQGRTYRKFPARRLPNPGSGSTAQIGIKVTFSRNVPPGLATPSFVIDITED